MVNVTRSSGVAERYPRWSPDGKTIAYWSDRTGEYELTLRPADGSGAEKKVTSLGPGFRYPPQWSPDSKKLAFIDQAMRIRIYDARRAMRRPTIDQSPDWISHGGLEAFRLQWSPDSRWLTYARPTAPANNAIFLYDTKAGEAAPGDDRVPERHAADLRSRRQVSVLRVRPRVRAGLRQLRQHLDLPESDAARGRAAAEGRQVAARRAQRRGESAARHERQGRRRRTTPGRTLEEARRRGQGAGAVEAGGPPEARSRLRRSRRQEGRRQQDGREERRQQEAGGTPACTGQRRHRSRRLRGARGRAAAEGGQLRRPAVDQGQAALSPPAAHRLERREEPDRLLRFRRSAKRRRCSTMRTRSR